MKELMNSRISPLSCAAVLLAGWSLAALGGPPVNVGRYTNDTLVLYAVPHKAPNLDVTGLYVTNGIVDGVNSYARSGLVDGTQYYLYRNSYYSGSLQRTITQWFVSAQASGYPLSAHPWWYRYDDLDSVLMPNGASGATGRITPYIPTVTNAAALQVKSGHPILFVDSNVVAEAKAKTVLLDEFVAYEEQYYIKTTNASDTAFIRSQADGLTDGLVNSHEGHYSKIALNYGVYALLTDDPVGEEYCRQLCLSVLDRPVNYATSTGDGYVSGVPVLLGILYDYAYDALEPALRTNIRERIVDTLDEIQSRYGWYSSAFYSGGHDHYGAMYGLIGLLAIRDEIEGDDASLQTRYFEHLRVMVNRWIDGYNPVYEWVAEGGATQMGWAYGPSFTRFYPYLAWEYATDEPTWFAGWQEQRALFFLYGLRNTHDPATQDAGGYDHYPVFGDSYGTGYNFEYHGLETLVSATRYSNPHAAWLYDTLGKSSLHWRLLYEPTSWARNAPPDDLPLARHFPNAGFVIMRDSWDFGQNTLLTFKSSSFGSHNHHHLDQNTFVLYYKGPLAIDSGAYSAMGRYESIHWENYYTRTVAHNGILVYDPNENWGLDPYGRQRSNDGGQRIISQAEPAPLQMEETGTHGLTGIVRYENQDDYAYTVGDATKAYSGKVVDCTRSVVYLRNHSYDHPAIVVYDRVVSTNAAFKKTYLLHSINEPAVAGKTVMVWNDDGMSATNKAGLYQQTVLPADAVLTVVGGRTNNAEFLVHDDGTGSPRNYNDEADYETANERYQRSYREAGQWRVEVCPGATQTNDVFLHVLSVTDDPASHNPVAVDFVGTTNLDGVIVEDPDGTERTLVLIQKAPGALSETIDLAGKPLFARCLIFGAAANTRFNVGLTNNLLTVVADGGGALKSSAAGVLDVRLAETIYIDPAATYDGDGSSPDAAAGPGGAGAKNTWATVGWTAGTLYLQKRGTVYSGGLFVTRSNVGLGAYGEGARPIVDGCGVAANGIDLNDHDFATIEDLAVTNVTAYGIDAALSDGLTLVDCDISGCGAACVLSRRGTNALIRGNRFHNLDKATSAAGVILDGTQGFFVESNTFQDLRYPIDVNVNVTTPSGIIRYNEIFEFMDDGIAIHGVSAAEDSLYVVGNEIHHCEDLEEDGIDLFNSDRVVVSGNFLHDNAGTAIKAGGSSSVGNRIIGNLVVSNGLYGIRNNGSVSNVYLHNTMMGNDPNFYVATLSCGATVRNNLSLDGLQNGSLFDGQLPADDQAGIDYNLWWRADTAPVIFMDGVTYSRDDLAAFRAATDGGDHSLMADPMLNSAWAPSKLSPTIDAGTNTALTVDFRGNPIYGTPDIGAIEYQPPYVMGSNSVDVTGNVRVYADGKFRNTAAPSGTNASLAIMPEGGWPTNDYREWMNVSVSNWTVTAMTWTESSDIASNTAHTVGVLPETDYDISVNGTPGYGLTNATIRSDERVSAEYRTVGHEREGAA